MAKTAPPTAPKKIRDPRTGRYLEVRGVGALAGRLKLRPDVDLTKPILDQVRAGKTKSVAERVAPQPRLSDNKA